MSAYVSIIKNAQLRELCTKIMPPVIKAARHLNYFVAKLPRGMVLP